MKELIEQLESENTLLLDYANTLDVDTQSLLDTVQQSLVKKKKMCGGNTEEPKSAESKNTNPRKKCGKCSEDKLYGSYTKEQGG